MVENERKETSLAPNFFHLHIHAVRCRCQPCKLKAGIAADRLLLTSLSRGDPFPGISNRYATRFPRCRVSPLSSPSTFQNDFSKKMIDLGGRVHRNSLKVNFLLVSNNICKKKVHSLLASHIAKERETSLPISSKQTLALIKGLLFVELEE